LAWRSDVGVSRRLNRSLRFGIIFSGGLLFDHHTGVVFRIAPARGIQRLPTLFARGLPVGERCIRKGGADYADFLPVIPARLNIQK
jgi:hypothetical protein